MRKMTRIVGTFFVCILVAGVAWAQRVDGTLRGGILDPSGAVIEGAKVTVTNQGTGVSETFNSTSAGSYSFPNLLPGLYTLTVEKTGFQKFLNKDVQVRPNQITEADVRLTLGAASETVEVSAGEALVQTTTSTISNNLETSQLVGLPVAVNSGGVLNLATLSPGTTNQGGGVLGVGGSIGGTRPRMNNFTVDGLDDNDVTLTGPITHLVGDSIEEFQLITNQFSAEYGHSAGGQFNLITKTGTNNIHGTAFIINDNRNYNAFSNVDKVSQGCDTDPNCKLPRFDYSVIGGSAGGPIIKNKVFIFGAYQKQFAGFASSGVIITAPTAAGLANLKTLAQNNAVTNILDAFYTAPTQLACLPAPAPVCSTDVTNATSGTTLPVAVGEVGLNAPSFLNETDWNVNGDMNLSKHRISLRYLSNKQVQPNLSSPPVPALSGDFNQTVHRASFSDVVPITSRFVNEFRLGWSRLVNAFTVPAAFSNFPDVFMNDPALSSYQIVLGGPSSGGQNVYQLRDSMSVSKGAHTIKWGGEGVKWIAPTGFLPRERGEWQYHDFGELVNDYVPSDLAKRGAGTGAFDGNQLAFYGFVQDDWKVTPRLTLNLGIRYEWISIAKGEKLHKLNELSSLPGTPLIFRIPKSDTNNWAPRLGVAWDPRGDGRWAVRGGFGVSYDVQAQNFPLNSQPPQLQSEQDPNITCALPGPPAWCANFVGGNHLGQGFLAGGGLLQVNIPPANQLQARTATQSLVLDHVMPKVYNWTLSVQHEISKKTSLEVRYLGTRGLELLVQRQVNAISAFDNGGTALPTYFNASDVPATFAAGTPTAADFLSHSIRPYASAGFAGPITSFPPDGDSIYHSGSVDLIHRMGLIKGLYLRANYTFAKNIDTATNELFSSAINPRRAEDGNHIENERGRSALDIRHKGAVSWVYDLPKFSNARGFKRALMNGWQYNGAFIMQTGQPVTAQSGIDANGNKDTAGDRAVFNPAGDRHLGTGIKAVCWDGTTVTINASCSSAQTVGYLANNSNAAYVRAGVGVRTNVGRNTLTSPGRSNWDMAFAKNTYITETRYIQVRAEAFNIFNHRQFSFANPGVYAIVGINDSAIGASAYDRVDNGQFLNPKQLNGGSRQIQLNLKFFF